MYRLRLTLFILLSTIALIAIALNVRAQEVTYLPIVSLAGDTPTPTASATTETASPTPNALATQVADLIQTLTAQPTSTETGTATPNALGTLVGELQLTLTAIVPTATSTPSETPTATPSATETPTATPSATMTPDVPATIAANVFATLTAVAVLSETPTPTASPSATATATPSATPSPTITNTPNFVETVIAALTLTAQAPGGTIPQP